MARKRWSILPGHIRLLDGLFSLAAPLVMLLLLEGFSRGDIGAVCMWLWQKPLLFLLNYLLLLGVCLAISCIRPDRVRACVLLVMCMLCALLGVANRYKMLYRLEPLLFTDVTQLGDAMSAVTELSFDVNIGLMVGICVASIALMALCCVSLKGSRQTSALGLVATGLMIVIALPHLCTFALASTVVNTDMVDNARRQGTLYTAIAMENHRHELMRLDYNEQDVRADYRELQQAVQDAPAAEVQPNIVLVLWESFADEAWLNQYITLTDTLMPYYNSLVTQSQTGHIYVPKMGGGTSETEFEVLTGIQSRYSYNPYTMGLPPMNSMASILREKGYLSTAIHWNPGVFYNRYKNLRMEGFNAFYTTDTTTTDFQKTGMYVNDQEHFDAALTQIKESDERDFVFLLTMQNHGSYDYDDFRITYGADTPFSNDLSDEAELMLANYCWLLRQSDLALERFITDLEAFEEPTIVILYGDHIPPFGEEVLAELGVDTKSDKSHLTPYLIWSNQETLTGTQDMYAYQLGAHALSIAGLNDDPFMAYIERQRKAGINTDDCYDVLCYDALFGEQYAYDEGGLSPECTDFKIGGEMVLDGFDVVEMCDVVYVRPRLCVTDQAYKLCVNGTLQSGSLIKRTNGALTLQCKMTYDGDRRIFNESNTLTYESMDDFLSQSGRINMEETLLAKQEYMLLEDRRAGNYYVFASKQPFWQKGQAYVLIGDTRYQYVQGSDVNCAGQYGVDDDGYVYFAVKKRNMDGYAITGEGFRDYLQNENGRVLRFAEE